MKSTILGVTFIWMFCSFSPLFAQDDYNPEFLIPYNDHGKWGFCDTLGSLMVNPQFESAAFFYKKGGLMVSPIEWNGKWNYYAWNYGVMAPNEHRVHWQSFSSYLVSHHLSIIEKEDKIGLFDYSSQQVLITPEYKELYIDTLLDYVYFSEPISGEASKIVSFSVGSQKSEILKYRGIKRETIIGGRAHYDIFVFKDKKGKLFQRNTDGWSSFSYEGVEVSPFAFEGEGGVGRDVSPYNRNPPKFNRIEHQWKSQIEGGIVYSTIFLGYYAEDTYQVIYKDGGFGLANQSKLVLPFTYDFIETNYYEGNFYLLKDKKMGVHIPLTSYPTISPKYDLLLLDRKLQVNDNWSFAIFKIKNGNDEGYIGENGIEYFKFD